MPEESRVIQVTNVAPSATREQMRTLFAFIGKIEDVQLYPDVPENLESVSPKICYVQFYEAGDVCVSLHLTNTVFIDRALLVQPVPDGRVS